MSTGLTRARRNARRFAVAAAIVVLAAAAAACATVAKAVFAQPVVTLRDVRLVNVSFDAGTFDVVIKVFNPNDFDLDASSVKYSVLVDDAVIGSGSMDERVMVPALDSNVFHFPMRVNWQTAGPAGQSLMRAGTVNYEVKGEMKIESGFGTMTLPYDQRGQFSALGKH